MGGFHRVNISVRRQLAKDRELQIRVAAEQTLAPARTAGNYLRYTIHAPPAARAIDLAVTTACNLACKHCAVARLRRLDSKCGPRTTAAWATNWRGTAFFPCSLRAAKPLLRPDLEQIITALRPQRFFISLITNGLLATRERLAVGLKRVGLDNACISMDDWHPAEHDRWRDRQGVHEQAVHCIDRALELGLSVMLFTVATHQDIRGEGLRRLIELAAKRACCCRSVGRCPSADGATTRRCC